MCFSFVGCANKSRLNMYYNGLPFENVRERFPYRATTTTTLHLYAEKKLRFTVIGRFSNRFKMFISKNKLMQTKWNEFFVESYWKMRHSSLKTMLKIIHPIVCLRERQHVRTSWYTWKRKQQLFVLVNWKARILCFIPVCMLEFAMAEIYKLYSKFDNSKWLTNVSCLTKVRQLGHFMQFFCYFKKLSDSISMGRKINPMNITVDSLHWQKKRVSTSSIGQLMILPHSKRNRTYRTHKIKK